MDSLGSLSAWLFLGVAHTWLRGEPASVAISGNESIPAIMQQLMADCEGASWQLPQVPACDTAKDGFVHRCRIVVIRVCQRHALCNRQVGWDIPRIVWIAGSNALAKEDRVIGPVNSGYLFRCGYARAVEECGCSAAASQVRRTTESENSSCLLLNSSSARDVRRSRRSPRLWR